MLIAFGLVLGMLIMLVLANTHQAVLHFIADGDYVKLSVYLGVLTLLGFLVIHLGFRVVSFARQSQEILDKVQ